MLENNAVKFSRRKFYKSCITTVLKCATTNLLCIWWKDIAFLKISEEIQMENIGFHQLVDDSDIEDQQNQTVRPKNILEELTILFILYSRSCKDHYFKLFLLAC